MKIFWVVLFGMSFFLQSDEPLAYRNFAYGHKIKLEGDGAIYSITLPDFVYRSVTRPDLGDLRVFNGQEYTVPYSLGSSEQPVMERLDDQELPFFPLYENMSESGSTSLQIITTADGSIIRVEHGKGTVKKAIRSFLVDCSGLMRSPEALLVAWPKNAAGFVINVRVYGSGDLTNWAPIGEETSLSNLHYGSHDLIQQRIDLPVFTARYLRVDVPMDDFPVSSFTARFPETQLETPRQSARVKAQSYDKNSRSYFFDTKAVYPSDRLQVELPQRNTLIDVKIHATNDTSGQWQERYSGPLYDLRIGDNRLRQNAIRFFPTAARYWRLTLTEKEATLGDGMPELHLEWIPHQLVFVAQGDPPYVLAYGSVSASPAETSLEKILNGGTLELNRDLVKTAVLTEPVELGGAGALVVSKPSNWQIWLLWSVLIIGVIALAAMAVRLYKQMNKPA